MKLSFNRAAFSQALGLLTSVIPARTPKPILRCILISAEGKQVYLSATDLEVGIKYAVSEVQIEKPGSIVVPADHLSAIVRESLDEILTIEQQQDNCIIKGADSEFTVYTQDKEQYPSVPDFRDESGLQINLRNLQDGIEQSLFATAKESTRYALNGVLWEIAGKKITLIATDGRRLAKKTVNLSAAADQEIEKKKIIVPAKTMGLLDKIGGSEDETVAIKIQENQIVIKCSNIVISSNLVDGNFPKYEDIIPKDYNKKLTLSTSAALSAVRRSALLASDDSRGIKLSIIKKKIVFSARAPESGNAKIEMPVDYDGDPIDIGFNPQFLIDVLKILKTPEFDMELGQSDRPGLIRSGRDFMYVLMPINLG